MRRFTLGVDFGTSSVRASLLPLDLKEPVVTAERSYGVYTGSLPDGTPLKPLMALADPEEYLCAMAEAVREALRASGVPKEAVIGIGVDSTSITMVASNASGTPMCALPRWRSEPSAYAKLWKSHSAEREARRIEACAEAQRLPFLDGCSHSPSSEWLYPKALETLRDAPALYRDTAFFLDACDWITWRLTGRVTRSYGAAACKVFYTEQGYPPPAFWREVDPAFEGINEKLAGPLLRWGERAGSLTPALAERLGLPEGIAVAASSLDGHVPMAALGLRQDGDLLLSIGTSNVLALISDTWSPAAGACSAAKDAMTPGFYGYDTGQAAVGDMFAWFVDNCVPARYFARAEREGISVHTLLSRLGFEGERASVPLALDWFNGNRSPLCRLDLSGAVAGLTLHTRPEDLYRALIESTAFGARAILDSFERHGLSVRRIRACGGISRKNPILVQCYADVFGREIAVSTLDNAAAMGAAITAASAAGARAGGFDGLFEAMDALGSRDYTVYKPSSPAAVARYQAAYERYRSLGGALLREQDAALAAPPVKEEDIR